MSPAERTFWLAANKRASRSEPEIAKALLRALQILRDSMSETEFARVIQSGNVEAFIADALAQENLDRAFIPFRRKIREAVDSHVRYFAKSLPGQGKIDGVIAVEFNVLNPRVIDAIRDLDTRVVQAVAPDARAVLRATVEQGLRDGKNPRAIARQAREGIGMAPYQQANLAKRQAEWSHTLSPDQVEKRAASYTKAAVKINAETNARTASLDAMKEGQRLSWIDAKDKGVIPAGARMTKTWRGVLDTRERPEHRALEGVTVDFESPYPNGEMTPGSSTFNCRCVSIVRVA